MLGGAWQVLRTGRVRRATSLLVVLTALVAWSLASMLWVRDQNLGVLRAQTGVQLLVFAWVAWQIALARRDVRAMAAGFVAGCVVASFGVWRAFTAGEILEEYEIRYSAPGFDPNELGITLAIGIPIAMYLARTGERRRRLAWLAYVPIAFVAIGLGGSRSAFLAAALATVGTLALTSWRSPWALAAGVAFATIGGAVAWSVVPKETWERIFTLQESVTHGTMGERLPIWKAGIAAFGRHPLAGVGLGGFSDAVASPLGQRTVAHNALLSVAVELGVVGAVLFLAAVVCVVRAALHIAARDRTLVATVIGTWLIGAASLTWELGKVTWFVLLLCAAVSAVPRRDEAVGGMARAA
ncbi:O-antigen ligase family protein [Anaeromyxobacter oryzae]|uniref:O-antigen ligase-related domain-containing protein n=1 Tax=Anaeromyxobacter oryzae TaxID=2918170 RepID=A0ABN6MZE5_9BACT|nr:O-antigen ligase family protein [Anaeromyxobacter oryzae]BDG06320.1 hypothetical protein AMOR_53160 [Anaeromyxobacter oryzae]